MKIEVKIFPIKERKGKTVAFAAVTLDGYFVVHDVTVVEGENGLFVGFPSKKGNDGEYHDIAHPVTKEAREESQAAVVGSYEGKVGMLEAGEAVVRERAGDVGGAGDDEADLDGEELPFA